MLLSLLLVLQPLPTYPGDEFGAWTCQKLIEGSGGALWVGRVLDREGRLAREEIAWHGEGRLPMKMSWRLGEDGTRVPAEFSAFVTWTRTPRRPVKLVIATGARFEERPLIRREDLAIFRDGAIPVQIAYLLDLPDGGAVPSLYGVEQLTLTAVEEGGASVGSAQVSLPDWAWLAREAASARALLAAQVPASTDLCRQAEPPIEEPPELLEE
jgi:hypothetical protein